MPWVTGWYEGVTRGQLCAGAVRCIRRRRSFVIEWWGLREVASGDHRDARSLEVGDRAATDAARENSLRPGDRRDWIMAKGIDAVPVVFSELLAGL